MKRSERLGMRVKSSDKQVWRETAVVEGKSLSKWIEETLNAATKKDG